MYIKTAVTGGTFFFIVTTILISLSSVVSAQEGSSALSAKQRAIVPIAALTAKGDQEHLTGALTEGLEAGLSVNEIKEILVQMYAYAGFPRSLNGINTFMALMDERGKKGIKDISGEEATPIPANKSRERLGHETREKLTGVRPVAGYAKFVPVIDTFLKEHLFADIFGRGVLDYKSREIATVSAIAAIGNAGAQLRSHMNVAMNTGVTESQLEDLVSVLRVKVGEKEADDAGSQLNRIKGPRTK